MVLCRWDLGLGEPRELTGVRHWAGVSLEDAHSSLFSFSILSHPSQQSLAFLPSRPPRHRRSHSFSTTHARDPLPSRIFRLHVPQHLHKYNIRHQDVLQDSPSQRSLRSCGCSVCCPDLHQRAQPDHRRPGPGYHLRDQRHHQREYLARHCNMANKLLTSHSP